LVDEKEKDKGPILWTSMKEKQGKSTIWKWAQGQPQSTKGNTRDVCVCALAEENFSTMKVENCEYPKHYICYKNNGNGI